MPAAPSCHGGTACTAPALRHAASGGVQTRPVPVDSQQLLQGHQAIQISHNGVLYRLQATRLGKLILTK